MHIKKLTTSNCELIPQLFLHKNQQGRKIHQPLSDKFMWLQKYAQDRDQTIDELDQFMNINEFTTYNDQDEDKIVSRNNRKKLKHNTSVNQENSSRSRLMGINLNQLNILCYKNDNKKALVKQKQNLQNNQDRLSLVMGAQAHNSQNSNRRFHCKSTDICPRKYESHQLSARKRYNLSNLHSNRNTQIVNKLQFKKSYNVLKPKYRLPTSKTTRRVINPPKNHQTINIKNTYSERNTNQRKYSANQKTHRKILYNKQNQIESFKTFQEQQKQQNKLSYAQLQKMKMELMSQNYTKNKYNNQKRIRKKSALQLSERDNNIDINPWKHQQSQISFQQINLTYQ